MEHFDAAFFSGISVNLGIYNCWPDTPEPVSDGAMATAVKVWDSAFDHCVALGLTTSAMTLRKMLDAGAKDKCQYREIRALAIELHGRLIDEMRGRFFSR
ncbi:MAG: hypothetical protein ACR2KU_00015 [Gammaproteobacteria bacterium]